MSSSDVLHTHSNLNDEYWLCLEPYVFIFKGDKEYLIYNALSFDKIIVNKNENIIIEILDYLSDPDNLYTYSISGNILSIESVSKFIKKLKSGFSCDLFSKKLYNAKPAIIPPILYIKNSFKNIARDIDLQRVETYLNFFHELTIYLNGKCNKRCDHCIEYSKQFTFCSKSSSELSKDDINVLFKKLKTTYISKINITGGNIFLYENFNYFLKKIENINTDKIFHIHYKNIEQNKLNDIFTLNNAFVNIFVNYPFNKNIISKIIENNKNHAHRIYWEFIVSNENEFKALEQMLKSLKIENFSTKPFYNNNLKFFHDYIFNTKDDILDLQLSKKEIYTRQSINLYNYGKFIMTSDKKFYTNLNYPESGTLNDNFIDLIEHELNDNSSWFKTRDKLEICNNCVFRFLCPSPSSYEFISKKSDFCLIETT